MTRERKLYIFAFGILFLFISGFIIIWFDFNAGLILMLPMILLATTGILKGRTRRCIECGKKLQRHSAFIDYCLDCGRKKELMKSRSS